MKCDHFLLEFLWILPPTTAARDACAETWLLSEPRRWCSGCSDCSHLLPGDAAQPRKPSRPHLPPADRPVGTAPRAHPCQAFPSSCPYVLPLPFPLHNKDPTTKMFFLFSMCSSQIRKPQGPGSARDRGSTRCLPEAVGLRAWSVPRRAGKQPSWLSRTPNPRSAGKLPDPNF